MRNGIIRKKMQKTVLKQGVQIKTMTTMYASMRPWHFSHGNYVLGAIWIDSMDASMRPWHFSHGNRTYCR